MLKPDMGAEQYSSSEALAVEHASNLTEVLHSLERSGLLHQGGVLLTDVDETLRPSLEDRISPEHFLKLGRVPEETTQAFATLKENAWNLAVVTNQPREGHQIATIAGELFNYTPLMSLLREQNIPCFGWEPSHRESIRSIVGDAARFYGGVVQGALTKGERGLYKSSEEAIQEVGDWALKTMENSGRNQIVWVGNNKRDTEFGKRLHAYIQNKLGETGGAFRLFQLPDFYYQGHPEQPEAPPVTLPQPA